MEEKELVRQILLGNQKATEEFYRLYKPKLWRYILQKAEPQAAEEILQDTFISALASLATFSGKSTLYSWLLGIARHEIGDFYRRRKIKEIVFSRLPFLEKLVSRALSPEFSLEEKELKERLKQHLGNMSEGYRQILRLKYIENLSVAEIAQKLKISLKACESKLFRARLAFQKEFASQEPTSSKYRRMAKTSAR
jgi:RNA polymerase sigma-70 factor (ECF subfamily)